MVLEIEKGDFLKRYLGGESIQSLSSTFKLSSAEIWSSMIKSCINKGMTRVETAHELNIHLSRLNRLMKKNKIINTNLPRHNYVKESFAIEDEISAYIAGLFWSDGHLSMDRLTITFVKTDMVLIKTINQFFFGDYTAYKEVSRRNCLRINIFNLQIRTDFLNLGLKNNDSGRSLPPMKEELFRHFLRGFIDGDGTISKIYPRVSIAGRSNFLNQIGIVLNSLGFKNAYTIRESPKSVKTRTINKYGTLDFYQFYHFTIYKFLYKNSNFYLPRKYDAIQCRFTAIEYELEFLRRRHRLYFVLKHHETLSKQHGDIIRYAFPSLFVKNVNCFNDLNNLSEKIEQELNQNGKSFPQLALTLKKHGLNASEASVYRHCKKNKQITQRLKEHLILDKYKSEIDEKIKSGLKTKKEIANDLNVAQRRVYGRFQDVAPLNRIKMVNPNYFDIIDSWEKAFFIGFLLMRNSINTKYLNIKFINPQHCLILNRLAKELYGNFTPNVIRSENSYKYSFGSTILVQSLKELQIDKKSLTTMDRIDHKFWEAFLLGILYSKLTVTKLKTGFCAQISGDVETMTWIQGYLLQFQIILIMEKNNPRKRFIHKEEYKKLIDHFGSELHNYHTKTNDEFDFDQFNWS